jgi:hypothetical protein
MEWYSGTSLPSLVSFEFLRTTVLEKLAYILVTMNETSILHLADGKVTLQARRAVNQTSSAGVKLIFRPSIGK